jgi:hypothetical protein
MLCPTETLVRFLTHMSSLTYLPQSPPWSHQSSQCHPHQIPQCSIWPLLVPPAPMSPQARLHCLARSPTVPPALISPASLDTWPGGAHLHPPSPELAAPSPAGARLCPPRVGPWPKLAESWSTLEKKKRNK